MGWINPTGSTANGWVDPTYAYNGNTGNYATYTVSGGSWTNYLEMSISSTAISQVRVYGSYTNSITTMDIDIYYDSAWHNVYSSTYPTGAYVTQDLGGTYTVTGIRVRGYRPSGGGTRDLYIHDTGLYEAPTSAVYNKISGTWKQADSYSVKVSGTWKTVDSGYKRESGSWNRIY